MSHNGKFDIFADFDFDSFSRARLEQLRETIRREGTDYILNVNPAEYVAHLVSSFSIDPLVLHFDRVEASSREEMIPAEDFPFRYRVYAGKAYAKPVIKYHLPATGDLDLLKCVPNPRDR